MPSKLTLTHKFIILLLSTSVLAACTANQQAPLNDLGYLPPQAGDGGIEIARTSVVGRPAEETPTVAVADCDAIAVGVQIDGVQGDEHYIFDSSGNPCPAPQRLFDGRNPVDARAADPAVNIRFVDELGYVPPRTGADEIYHKPEVLIVPPNQPIKREYPAEEAGTARDQSGGLQAELHAFTAGLPPEVADEAATQRHAIIPPPTDLEGRIAAMMQREQARSDAVARKAVLAESERLLADIRDLERMSEHELIEAHQERIESLTSQLREQERQLASKVHHQATIQARIVQAEQQQAAQQRFMQAERSRLQEDREQLQLRLAEIGAANERLANRQEQRERALLAQISQLSANLEAAEIAAEQGRHELVLEAAQRIAEAEQLAQAARQAQQQAQQREALRLKAEGEMMMERALAINEGQQIVVEGLSDQLNQEPAATQAPIPLAQAPLFIEAVDQPLTSVFEQIFNQIQPLAGTWRHRFELDEQNKYVLGELWTVTAETTFGEFMASIAAQVQAEHSVQLRYRQFDTARLFIVSDR